jgi:hypothetical protein
MFFPVSFKYLAEKVNELIVFHDMLQSLLDLLPVVLLAELADQRLRYCEEFVSFGS